MRSTTPQGYLYSPYFLWHGRYPTTPVSLLGRKLIEVDALPPTLQTLLEDQLRAAKIVLEMHEERVDASRSKSEALRQPPVWNKGQLVLVHRDVVKN